MPNKKINLYLFQFNFSYGNDVYLPYSIGTLWAYAKTIEWIAKNYENKGFIFMRKDPQKIVDKLENPRIAAFSTYVWNWQMSIEVARRIKEIYPQCLIIFGGPQVPDQIDGFFERYPFIDITVHGEGEIAFSEILIGYLDKNYGNIQAATINKGKGDMTKFAKKAMIPNINILPSPYLNHVFDDILKLPYSFQAIWETNRGCPYGCAYCDWGFSNSKKIRAFDNKRLQAEIEWFGNNKISFILGADSNFGILPRDLDLANRLAQKKAETKGYPGKYRVSYAKNSDDRVLQIAKILHSQKLDKGISLSVQSMDDNTLKIIKRQNIKIESLANYLKKYQMEGIPTYTELILGLPGETYESFKEGINKLLIAGVHNSLAIYNCAVLPNALLNQPNYKKEHAIKTITVPIFLNHSIPGNDPIQEYEEIVIGTKTLTTANWIRQYIFAWITQTCHTLNLTQPIAIYFNYEHSLGYSNFYEELLEFAKHNPNSLLGKELVFTANKVEAVLKGASWDIILPEFSNISWATDEASYLRISENFDEFYVELSSFIEKLIKKYNLKIDTKIVEDLINYQKAVIVKWDKAGDKVLKLNYPLHHFYMAKLIGEKYDFNKGKYLLKITDDLKFNGDKERYSREIIWWGRKGGKMVYQNIEETKIK